MADDKIPFLKGVLEPYAEVVYLPGKQISHADVKDADGLIVRTRTRVDRDLLEGSAVKMVATATIGFDHIDTVYCEQNGIKWTNAGGCNSSSVQQYIGSCLCFLAKNFLQKTEGKMLGIVGVGNVGKKIAKLGKALGMNIMLNDPPRARIEGENDFVKLDELLQSADIITLHVPLNMQGQDKTYHLADADFFRQINPDAYLINSSRGEVVDSKSLKKALRDKQISGAILDVFENEPEIDPELLEQLLIGTPHIAGYSLDGKANGTSMSVDAIAKFFKLPLQNWFPSNLPSPKNRGILIDCSGLSSDEIVREAIAKTYDVVADSQRLKTSPGNFEELRGNYPVRREFHAFDVKLFNDNTNAYEILYDIGFNMLQSNICF